MSWLPPVVPRTIFAVGLNYADHAKELAFQPQGAPLVFLKGPRSVAGHRAATERPRDAAFMHYECELAVVIGRTAKAVPVARALEYVAGYMSRMTTRSATIWRTTIVRICGRKIAMAQPCSGRGLSPPPKCLTRRLWSCVR